MCTLLLYSDVSSDSYLHLSFPFIALRVFNDEIVGEAV